MLEAEKNNRLANKACSSLSWLLEADPKNKGEPHQLPEKPKGLNLDEAEPKTEAETKNRAARPS